MPVWGFDLDGTLIGSVRNDRLRSGAVDLLIALDRLGASCVLWSAGGAVYARRKAEEHSIAHHFAAFYDKADRGVDGRYVTHHFAAEHRPDVFVDDSPDDVPADVYTIAVRQFIGGNRADQALLRVLSDLHHHLDAAG